MRSNQAKREEFNICFTQVSFALFFLGREHGLGKRGSAYHCDSLRLPV